MLEHEMYISDELLQGKYILFKIPGTFFLVLISLKQFSKVNFHYKIMFTGKENRMEVIPAKNCVKYGLNVCLNFISHSGQVLLKTII